MRFASLLLIVSILPTLVFALEPATKPAADVLKRNVAEVKFDDVALADAIGFLGDISGTTLTADWNALRKEKIDVTTTVKLHAKEQTLAQVLDALLLQLSPEKKLTYTMDKDTIEITTKAAAEK